MENLETSSVLHSFYVLDTYKDDNCLFVTGDGDGQYNLHSFDYIYESTKSDQGYIQNFDVTLKDDYMFNYDDNDDGNYENNKKKLEFNIENHLQTNYPSLDDMMQICSKHKQGFD